MNGLIKLTEGIDPSRTSDIAGKKCRTLHQTKQSKHTTKFNSTQVVFEIHL